MKTASVDQQLLNAWDEFIKRVDPQVSDYAEDPSRWVEERIHGFLWSKQREVAESVRDNRYTAVQSAHQTGKSYVAAALTSWWLDTHPQGSAFVVTSAPTAAQVTSILWREIQRMWRKGNLDGDITGTTSPTSIPTWTMGGEIVAFGRKPADKVDPEEAMQAFQGVHALYVLVILDEACGIPQWLYDASDSLVGNDECRVLAIGNPDNPSAHFRNVCRPGSGWNTIRISALDTPAFTGEEVPDELLRVLVGKTWVKERVKRWGKKSPIFISKVMGLFPDVAEDTLISPAQLEAACLREIKSKAAGRYGVDVADGGNDESVIYLNKQGHIRLAQTPDGRECSWRGHNVMQVAGEVASILRHDKGETGAVIDSIGVGAGTYSRLLEQGLPVSGFKASNKAQRKDKFRNRRSEMWWSVRELFEDGLIDLDPTDEDLLAQLGAIRWWVDSSGRTCVESKEETVKRIKAHSPDRADALMMSCVLYDPLPPKSQRGDYRDNRKTAKVEISAGVMEAAL